MPGRPTDSAYKAAVPVKILTDPGGNHFIRITGSPTDNFCVPRGSGRVRSELYVGAAPSWSSAETNRSVTYSFSVRMPGGHPSSAVIMQLYQWSSDANSGYGVPDGNGPTAWLIWSNDEGMSVRNNYNNETELQILRLGKPGLGKWVHISIGVYWTLDAATGKTVVL